MGATFCNIQVYNPKHIAYELKKEYCIRHFMENWDTIYDDSDDPTLNIRKLERTAQDISLKIKTSALIVNYYDDDIFEITAIEEGKKRAFYRTDGINISTKNVPVLISSLNLNDTDSKCFRILSKMDLDAVTAIDLMSGLCEIPLRMDKRIYDESDPTDTFCCDKQIALKRISDEDKRLKTLACMKSEAELIQEFCGKIMDSDISPKNIDNRLGIIRTLEYEPDGSIDYKHINCYQIAKDIGRGIDELRKIHDYRYPIGFDDPNRKFRLISKYPDDTYKIESSPYHVMYELDEELNKLIDKTREIPIDKLNPTAVDLIDAMGTETVERKNGFSKFYGGREYRFEIKGKRRVIKCIDMNIQEEECYIDENNGCYFLSRYIGYDYADDKNVVLISEKTEENNGLICVEFYDLDYNLIRKVEVREDRVSYRRAIMRCPYVYIRKRDQIVIGRFVIDLNSASINIRNDMPEKYTSIVITSTKSGDDRLVMINGSLVYLYDLDLSLKTSFHLKGKIDSYYSDHEGHMYFVTADNSIRYDTYRFSELKESDRIRLYRVAIVS